jgi:flavin-dependent dehydrogenase
VPQEVRGYPPGTVTGDYDVLVIGAGPTGATAALRSAQNGFRTAAFEGGRHPRFHIGESLLPRNMTLLRELGLAEELKALPQVYKIGASFAFAHETGTTDYHFERGLLPVNHETLNIERAPFDRFLCAKARERGAAIHEGVAVRRIERLDDDGVVLAVDDGSGERTVRAASLIDASGQAAVLGRHLGLRRMLPDLKKIASYAHFRNVHRNPGRLGGYPQIIMCDEGWFWFIPLDEERTSIGLVMRADLARRVDVPPKRLVFWGLERCPIGRKWTEGAQAVSETYVSADFSYTCRPFAGPGFFLAGDAATFVDPIFSTGVCLGMMTAVEAADSVLAIRSGRNPAAVRRRYARFVEAGSSSFFRLVRGYYRHGFRELFLHNDGPLRLQQGINSVLTGNVFPRLTFSLAWRLRLFEILTRVQPVLPLAPRRSGWSLLQAAPTPSRSH